MKNQEETLVVGWLVKNHPEIFEGAGLLLNEGGSGIKSNDTIVFSVEITQKVPVWLRLTAIDTPGHGSSPRSTSSVSSDSRSLKYYLGKSFSSPNYS